MDERTARFIERHENQHWGKYRGIVAERDDPEELGRLKVRVPSLLGDAVSGWAWPAGPYAGAGIGFFAIPQQGDLVWVEFVEGELDHPVWSGGAWAKPGGTPEIPAEARQAYPDRVVMRTPSGNVVIVSDEPGKEAITIRTTNGCEVVLEAGQKRVTVLADEVLLRGSGGTTQELATKAFVKDVFDKHTHATGVGPSGPPVPDVAADVAHDDRQGRMTWRSMRRP